MERRDFGRLAAAGALLVGSGCRRTPVGRKTEAATTDLGRPPMKWGIKHSLQIQDLQPETLQLAKQLGLEWVKIGAFECHDLKNTRKPCGASKRRG